MDNITTCSEGHHWLVVLLVLHHHRYFIKSNCKEFLWAGSILSPFHSSFLISKKQSMKKLLPSLKRPTRMVVELLTSLSGAPRLLTRTSCSTRATCELLSLSSTRTVEAPLRLPRSPPSLAKTSTLTTPSGEKWSVKSIQMVTEWSTLMNSRPWCLGLLIADQIGHKKKQKGSD